MAYTAPLIVITGQIWAASDQNTYIKANFEYVKAILDSFTVPAGTVVGTSDTQTLTNKRITQRVYSEASNATPTPASDSYDVHLITAQAAAAAFAAPTGTPTQGQKLIIRVKDNGAARALTYDAIYRAVGATLPTTTVISKTLYLGFIYNSTDTKWDLVAVSQEV